MGTIGHIAYTCVARVSKMQQGYEILGGVIRLSG